jgi:hypothetical protein
MMALLTECRNSITSYPTICCIYLPTCGIYIAILPGAPQEGGPKMRRDYLVFIHAHESAMVIRVDVVRAFSRKSAMKKLEKMGFRKKKF